MVGGALLLVLAEILNTVLEFLFGPGYSLEIVFFFCFLVFILIYALKRK